MENIDWQFSFLAIAFILLSVVAAGFIVAFGMVKEQLKESEERRVAVVRSNSSLWLENEELKAKLRSRRKPDAATPKAERPHVRAGAKKK